MANLIANFDSTNQLDWKPIQPVRESVYQELTANASGRARRATRNGRNYLVAPATSIVPGVLPGSKGPLYYPPDEVGKNFAAWDGIPLTVYHPTDQRNGEHISVNSPGVLERQGIGEIAKTSFKGKLQHELWFDVDKTREADRRFGTDILNRLERGDAIELSTGLFTENEPAQNGANHNGRPYAHIARNYKPDHLAILPTGKGACSNQDGCGVLVNARTVEVYPGSSWQTPPVVYEGKAQHDWQPIVNEPSDELDMSPDKACEIMRDGTVHGQELSESQRGMFGALCGQRDKATKNEWTEITAVSPDGEWIPISNDAVLVRPQPAAESAYKFCPYCGGKIEADVCTKCGWKADYDTPAIGDGMAGNERPTSNCGGDKACGPCAEKVKQDKELSALEEGWIPAN